MLTMFIYFSKNTKTNRLKDGGISSELIKIPPTNTSATITFKNSKIFYNDVELSTPVIYLKIADTGNGILPRGLIFKSSNKDFWSYVNNN